MSVKSPNPRAWDDVSGVASEEPVKRFEASWKASEPSQRPDPDSFAGDSEPGVRLALFRADLLLRWENGEQATVERYRDRGLPPDALIALAYEEFCLREDHGETPDPSRFYARFPEIASGLKRVLEIHDLVGSARSTSTASMGLRSRAQNSSAFPEAGQTIAGFHLVEELGRGGFARVFLAQERQLGDRPVALKVAKTGSREPQTLARLQHTHIVPVHSYRIDPATDLHLLCMPFFGRITLAHLLADPDVKEARSGAELVAALDRLDPGGAALSSARAVGREALSNRPYARAIAWWGARLAEALQHAHDRGVLHRDVKPSNVLVTADGMPMLLDFNLAHEPLEASEPGDAPTKLGGTVAYMSPEHLEALADGSPDGVDARSDVYALGVVLFEAMGARPFGPPPASRTVREALLRAAEERRSRPNLREAFPEVPSALATVIERCLEPAPNARYATASHLAADLQAVADEMPLRYAREPVLVRTWSKVRRHRRAIAATATILLALGLAGFLSITANIADTQRQAQVKQFLKDGDTAMIVNQFDQARTNYGAAENLAANSPRLLNLEQNARTRRKQAADAEKTMADAKTLFAEADPWRSAFLGFDGARKKISSDRETGERPTFESILKPFYVLNNPDWTDRGELEALGPDLRGQLIREVHELLFLAAIYGAGSDKEDAWRDSLAICRKAREIRDARTSAGDRGILATLPEGPWAAVEKILQSRIGGRVPSASSPPSPSAIESPWECYQWGRIVLLEDRPDSNRASAWLSRAAQRDRGRFWIKFDAAYQADRAGRSDVALTLYNAAVELRPKYPRALANRARIERARGAWGQALEDLQLALQVDPDLVEARLELGFVQQALGNASGAIESYDRVIASPVAGEYRQAARLNRAKLDFDSGRIPSARTTFDALIGENPDDVSARLGRAQIAFREGDRNAAETDLNAVILAHNDNVEALVLRALVRLEQGKTREALADADAASWIEPSPRCDRIRTRVRLAFRGGDVPPLDDPQEVRRLPSGGAALEADLADAAERLKAGTASHVSQSTRAVIMQVLGQPTDAEREASLAVANAPLSPRTRLIRARIRHDRGDRWASLNDVAGGLEIEPNDPRLLALGGQLRLEIGDTERALEELERAIRLGAGTSATKARARALDRVGKSRDALNDWNRAIEDDPDDPSTLVGRARSFQLLGRWDQAVVDLERASELAGNRRALLAEIAWSYARCLPHQTGGWNRFAALTRNAIFAP